MGGMIAGFPKSVKFVLNDLGNGLSEALGGHQVVQIVREGSTEPVRLVNGCDDVFDEATLFQ
jgi:hypothetical protein